MNFCSLCQSREKSEVLGILVDRCFILFTAKCVFQLSLSVAFPCVVCPTVSIAEGNSVECRKIGEGCERKTTVLRQQECVDRNADR